MDDKENWVDPFEILADMFNDYTEYNYENASYPEKHKDSNNMDCYTSFFPSFTLVAKKCYAINPTKEGRPKRDGSWIKSKWKYISKIVTTQYQRFTVSGKQSGDDLEDRWVKFIENGREVVSLIVYYVITLMNLYEMNMMNLSTCKFAMEYGTDHEKKQAKLWFSQQFEKTLRNSN